MSSRKEKADHVKSAKQNRPHTCHWPGCGQQVKPAFWGCFYHWNKLPQYLKDKIWDAYRIGQEEDMRPSREYLKVAQEVNEWIQRNFNTTTPQTLF